MRSTGAGIPRAGQPISGHGVSGHGDIGRQPPDVRTAGRTGARPVARRVFCRWPCRDSCGFFNRRYRANSGAIPSAVSPRVPGGISFRAQGHFVSDFSREKIDQWSQCVAGPENLKRNETQKNRHAEVCKCGGSHPHAFAPGRTRDARTTGAAPGGSQPVVGKPVHSFPAFLRGRFRGPAIALSENPVSSIPGNYSQATISETLPFDPSQSHTVI